MAVKFKCVIKWSKQNQSSSKKVTATTLGAAAKKLASGGEWGECLYGFKYTYKTDGTNATEVTLTAYYDISMPTWSGYSKAPKNCQAEWDKMWKKLEEHEHGHRDIVVEDVKKFETDIKKAGAKGMTGKDVDAFYKTWETATNKRQKAFDTSTGNGKKKGVVLNITDECA